MTRTSLFIGKNGGGEVEEVSKLLGLLKFELGTVMQETRVGMVTPINGT